MFDLKDYVFLVFNMWWAAMAIVCRQTILIMTIAVFHFVFLVMLVVKHLGER